jgi:hypothetical protein
MKDKTKQILKAKTRLEKLEAQEQALLAAQRSKLAEIRGEILRTKARLYDLSNPEPPAA